MSFIDDSFNRNSNLNLLDVNNNLIKVTISPNSSSKIQINATNLNELLNKAVSLYSDLDPSNHIPSSKVYNVGTSGPYPSDVIPKDIDNIVKYKSGSYRVPYYQRGSTYGNAGNTSYSSLTLYQLKYERLYGRLGGVENTSVISYNDVLITDNDSLDTGQNPSVRKYNNLFAVFLTCYPNYSPGNSYKTVVLLDTWDYVTTKYVDILIPCISDQVWGNYVAFGYLQATKQSGNNWSLSFSFNSSGNSASIDKIIRIG